MVDDVAESLRRPCGNTAYMHADIIPNRPQDRQTDAMHDFDVLNIIKEAKQVAEWLAHGKLYALCAAECADSLAPKHNAIIMNRLSLKEKKIYTYFCWRR